MDRLKNVGTLLVAAGLAACGGTTTPSGNDSGTPDVVTEMDVQTGMDVQGTDGATDRGPQGDVRDVPVTDRPDAAVVCPLMGIDLNTAGMRMGDTLRYTGDSTPAYMMQNPTDGGVAARSPITAPSTCTDMRGQVVMTYTTGANPRALLITTTADGTPRDFDTVLWVTTARCSASLTRPTTGNGFLTCNDDDPVYEGTADRRVSSRVVTPVLTANSTVTIVFGGFNPPQSLRRSGPFELQVTELNPVAAGGACRVDNSTTICATGTTCVGDTPNAVMGTCRAPGTAPGTSCRGSNPPCDVGLICDSQDTSSGTLQVCARQGAMGAECDLAIVPAYRTCGDGLQCYNPVVGARLGTCLPAGSRVRMDCRPAGAATGRCDTGLTCNATVDPTIATPTCRTLAAVGAACSLNDSVCAAGSSCIRSSVGAEVGTCRADGAAAGTRCRTSRPGVDAGPPCDAGLECRTIGTAGDFCVTPVMFGGTCSVDQFALCPDDSGCFFTDLSNRHTGRCAADGTAGGACNTTGTACSMSLMCSVAMPTTANSGVCQTVIADGMPCQRPISRCGDNSTCVLNAGSEVMGTCRANGTAAGTSCRNSGTLCDMSMVCNGSVATANACQTNVAAGAACDPLHATTHCMGTSVCRPTAYNAGTCVAPTGAEMEPNNTPGSTLTPITAATTLTASLARGDVDCVAVTVPAMGGILAHTSDGHGYCPVRGTGGGIVLDLYNSDLRLIGSEDQSGPGNCSTIDGNRRGLYDWASGLDAGTYYVCARGLVTATVTTGAIDAYVLTVSPLPPRS